MQNRNQFEHGMIEGAGVSGLGWNVTHQILNELFPPVTKSVYDDLLSTFDGQDAHYLGHQFACVLASVRPKDRDSAIANLEGVITVCVKQRIKSTNN